MLEIFIPCGGRGGDDGDASDKGRERKELLRIQQSVGLQAGDGLLALPRDVTKGVRRIDTDDGETESIDRMPLDLCFHEHRHTGLERLPRLGFEISHEHLLCTGPTGSPHLRGRTVDEFKIEMSVLAAEAVHLRFYPIGRRQTVVQRFSYEGT